MKNKGDEKGFWTSSFTPKSCDCGCGTQIEEVKIDNLHAIVEGVVNN